MRSALGVALPLAAAIAFRNPSGGLVVAVGALNTAYSDGNDPYRYRARRMLITSLLCGLAVLLGGLTAQHHAAVVVVSMLFAFAAGMAVAVGTAVADVALITLVTLLVFSSQVMNPEKALVSGLLAFAGGLLQTALALALWPVWRYRNERRALGDLYAELARAAQAPAPAAEAPPASAQSTRAQQALQALDRSIESERYLALLSQAERIRLSLLSLARLRFRLARGEAPEAASLEQGFARAATVLAGIAASLHADVAGVDHANSLREVAGVAEGLRAAARRAASQEHKALLMDARRQLDALAGQLRSAVDLESNATPEGLATFEQREGTRPWRLRLGGTVAILRANLDWRSAPFRHGLRMAVCIGVGSALGRTLDLQRSYWIPMTVALVLKPDFGSTFGRGVQRMGGTLAGLGVATALFHLLAPRELTEILLVAVFTFLLRCLGPANYGIFTGAVSALIVLLFAVTGVAPQAVVAARAANTLAGGAIALAAYAAWPTWERTQVRELVARMLDVYRRYFQLVRDAYLAPGVPPASEIDAVRLAGRLARSNVEASVARLAAEPGGAASLALWNRLLANSHRFIHAAMSLEAGIATSRPVPARPEFLAFTNQVDTTLYFLSAALRGTPVTVEDLTDLREAYHSLIHSGSLEIERHALVNTEADRITNSLNTLAEIIVGRAPAQPANSPYRGWRAYRT